MSVAFHELPPAGLLRRVMAAIYDYILIAAIWMVTTLLVVTIFNLAHGRHGLALQDYYGIGRPPGWFLHDVLRSILIFEAWAFYAWFWMHGGQTLGMISWRIKVADQSGGRPALWQTLVRFFGAWISVLLCGAGYWLILFGPGQSLHDRLSRTETHLIPKPR